VGKKKSLNFIFGQRKKKESGACVKTKKIEKHGSFLYCEPHMEKNDFVPNSMNKSKRH
jgi:hypothetical protein